MHAPPRLRWLHRIGYVATAIVAAEILGVGGLVGWVAYQEHGRRVDRRDETAQHEGPYRQVDHMLPHLAMLPPLRALGNDGMRFVAYPELDGTIYAAAFRASSRGAMADGLLVIRRNPSYQRAGTIERYRCTMPIDRYRRLVGAVDAQTDRFAGSDRVGLDGTTIVVERVRGGRVTSGGGNMIEPYRRIGEAVLATLRAACPGAALPPAGQDWRRPRLT